jgi:hypothetical protein
MFNKTRRKRIKFYHVPSDHSRLAQPSRVRHSAFVSTAGKVSVRNSFVTVSTQDPPPAEEIHRTSSPIDNHNITMINDLSSLIPLDKADASVGQRRTPVCTYNSVYMLLAQGFPE